MVGIGGRRCGVLGVLIGSGFRAAIRGGYGRNGGLASIALQRDLLLLLAKLGIKRAKRLVEALIESRATLI